MSKQNTAISQKLFRTIRGFCQKHGFYYMLHLQNVFPWRSQFDTASRSKNPPAHTTSSQALPDMAFHLVAMGGLQPFFINSTGQTFIGQTACFSHSWGCPPVMPVNNIAWVCIGHMLKVSVLAMEMQNIKPSTLLVGGNHLKIIWFAKDLMLFRSEIVTGSTLGCKKETGYPSINISFYKVYCRFCNSL